MHADSRRLLASGLGYAALIALLAWIALRGGDLGGDDGSKTSIGAPREAEVADDVQPDAAAPDLARTEGVTPTGTTESFTLASDARPRSVGPVTTWYDRLEPYDHVSGRALSTWSTVLVTATGERRERAATEPLDDLDLGRWGVLAIVADGYCPRLVDVDGMRDLAGRVRVPVARAGRITVGRVGDLALDHLLGSVVLTGDGGSAREFAGRRARPELGMQSTAEFLDWAATYRGFLDADSDGRRLAVLRDLQWSPFYARVVAPGAANFLDPWLVRSVEAPIALPLVLERVPQDERVQVVVQSEVPFRLEPAAYDLGRSAVLRRASDWLDARTDEEPAVTVEFLRASGVRGRLPIGARDASVVVAQPRAAGTRLVVRTDLPVAPSGAFEDTTLVAGDYELTAAWSDDRGGAFARKTFELAEGEVLDLGELDPSGGGTVALDFDLAPDVVDRIGTLQLDRIRVRASLDVQQSGTRRERTPTLELIRGEWTDVRIAEGESCTVDFVDAELPASLDGLWRVVPFAPASIEAGRRVLLRVSLEPTSSLTLTYPVAPERMVPHTRFDGYLVRDGGRDVRTAKFTWEGSPDGGGRGIGTVALEPGTWTLFAQITVPEHDGERVGEYLTRREISIGMGQQLELDVDVYEHPGAKVVLKAPPGTELDVDARVRPVGFESWALAPNVDAGSSRTLAAHPLVGFAEYVLLPNGYRFTAGADGSTTTLDVR
ncbi:MAG: hypothetical protein R3F34_04080 [Planctomycetota bacterium]